MKKTTPINKKLVSQIFFTGDTLVVTADGRNHVAFNQLALEGKKVDVFSESHNKVICIKTIQCPKEESKKQLVYRVIFTNGESIKVTEKSSFFTKDDIPITFSELKSGSNLRLISKYKNERTTGLLNKDTKTFGDLPNLVVSTVVSLGYETVYSCSIDMYDNLFIGNFKGKVSDKNRLGIFLKSSIY